MYYVTNIIGIHINIYPIDTRQYICKNGIVYLWMIENTLTNTCVTIYFCIEYLSHANGKSTFALSWF